jgi:Ca2+-binding EF-hand superfamily protein
MTTLENNIRRIIARDYVSVRSAFLDLDQNRDGLIEPTDFIKRFGHMFDIQYEYLESILKQNARSETTKSLAPTMINYSDFSRWLGPTIHMAEGFFFRHDSKRNPHYEVWLKENDRRKGADRQAAAKALWSEETVLDAVIAKIRQYWGKTTKCYRDFNENNDDSIEKEELKFFLNHWGFPLTDE